MSAPDGVIVAGRSAWIDALTWVASVAKEKSVMPVGSCVLMDAHELGTTLTATDFDQTAMSMTRLMADVPFRVCLPAKRLLDYVTAFKSGSTITMTLHGTIATLAVGRKTFTLPGLPASEFPEFPSDEFEAVAQVPGPAFEDALRRILPIAFDDPSRPIVNSVRLDARDGRVRVAAYTPPSLAAIIPFGTGDSWEREVLIPRASVPAIQKLSGRSETVWISATERQVRVWTETESLTTRLVEGPFPPIDTLFAQTLPERFVLDMDEYTTAIRSVALAGKRDAEGYKITQSWASDELVLSVAAQTGQAEDNVPYVERLAGPLMFATTLKIDLLLDALSVIPGDTVRVDMASPSKATRFSSPSDPAGAMALLAPLNA